jgi:hypothetical protein
MTISTAHVCAVVLSLVLTPLSAADAGSSTRNESSVRIRANITNSKTKVVPGSSVVEVTISFNLELLNVGTRPILILSQDSPMCVGTTLTTDTGPAVGENILFDEYRGPSRDGSPAWNRLRRALDQPEPPRESIRLIEPGESWRSQTYVVLRPPVQFEHYRIDRPPVSWTLLRNHSPVWLRLQCETWPLNLETTTDSGRTVFGHKLQQRWLKYGDLQLSVLKSEPVRLDLRGE